MGKGGQAAAGADRQAADATESGDTFKGQSAQGLRPTRGSHGFPVLLMAVAGLIAGILAGASVSALPTGQRAGFSLQPVARDQIDDAMASLDVRSAGAAVEDARRCKAPLAFVVVSADAGATANAIRIRSGSYVSPPILVTPAPQRVAIPFPAPYATGHGVLIVDGAASGLNVWLTPGWHFGRLDRPAAINVVWTPKNAC